MRACCFLGSLRISDHLCPDGGCPEHQPPFFLIFSFPRSIQNGKPKEILAIRIMGEVGIGCSDVDVDGKVGYSSERGSPQDDVG